MQRHEAAMYENIPVHGFVYRASKFPLSVSDSNLLHDYIVERHAVA